VAAAPAANHTQVEGVISKVAARKPAAVTGAKGAANPVVVRQPATLFKRCQFRADKAALPSGPAAKDSTTFDWSRRAGRRPTASARIPLSGTPSRRLSIGQGPHQRRRHVGVQRRHDSDPTRSGGTFPSCRSQHPGEARRADAESTGSIGLGRDNKACQDVGLTMGLP
jgi:hypothetical protein